jgi:D-glycero-D-manno-heptose 1,7-bisphosphate phosphatase
LSNLETQITIMNKTLFLDRDGTLNALVYYPDTDEWESPRTVIDFSLLAGVTDALCDMQALGWSFIVISNQPSYAKGKTSISALNEVHDELVRQLASRGIILKGAYYCHHHPKAVVPELAVRCECRKPDIGMLTKAQHAYNLDLMQCWFIGDQDSDIFCGQRAGCQTIQLDYVPSQNKRGQAKPNSLCADLSAALAIVRSSTEVKEDLS